MRGAYLRGADLRGTYLRNADLTGADLRGADLREAYLNEADLTGADFSKTIFNEKQIRMLYGKYDLNKSIILLSKGDEIISYQEYYIRELKGWIKILTIIVN